MKTKKISTVMIQALMLSSCAVAGSGLAGCKVVSGTPDSSAKETASDSDPADESVIGQSLDAVDQKLQGAALVDPGVESAALRRVDQGLSFLASLFGVSSVHAMPLLSFWDDETGINGLNWKQTSLRGYLRDALNSEFRNPNGANITVFGRFRNEVRMLCAMDVITPEHDANGLPANGVYVRTIQVGPGSEISQRCSGFSNENAQTFEVQISVETPVDTSVYSKHIVMAIEGESEPYRFYIEMNDKVIRIASIERNVAIGAASRGLVDYDRAGDILRFEYLSQGFSADSGNELERIYINGPAKKAYLLSTYGTSEASPFQQNIRFIVAGSPVDAERTEVAVSVGYSGQELGDGARVEDRNACVKSDDGEVLDDDSLACQVPGLAISSATGIDATFSAHDDAEDMELSETSQVPFENEVDFHTAVSK